jgi:hypothetical protein
MEERGGKEGKRPYCGIHVTPDSELIPAVTGRLILSRLHYFAGFLFRLADEPPDFLPVFTLV